MKRTLMAVAVAMFAGAAFAQTDDKGYKEGAFVVKGVTGINMAQTAMSNWAAGGENSVAGNAYLNGSLTHKNGRLLWVTNLILDYGLSSTKSQGVRKSTDQIAISTQLGYSTNDVWFYTALADFNTQFAKGYNYPDKSNYISRFLAPAYSNVALGMEYRPKSNFSLFMSPLSAKMTFVNDDYLSNQGAFGVKPGKHFRFEAGAYLKGRAEMKLMENVNLITTADFFTPYNHDFGNVDINWDVLISMKVNKYLSATLNTSLKYDDDIISFDGNNNPRGPRVQLKEVFGIGLAYNF